jgi:hypothetical protein
MDKLSRPEPPMSSHSAPIDVIRRALANQGLSPAEIDRWIEQNRSVDQ